MCAAEAKNREMLLCPHDYGNNKRATGESDTVSCVVMKHDTMIEYGIDTDINADHV